MRVVTWNVLHRVHAMNWGEAPVARFPDEGARSMRIAERVAAFVADGVVAIALQEVSGDQVEALRKALPAGTTLLTHVFPRVPQLRTPGDAGLAAPAEHLVVVSTAPARRVASRTFPTDPGKGFLVAELETGELVASTHVSFGDRRVAQLAELAEATAAARAIVLGDFNAPRDVVQAAFVGAAVADLRGQRPTRIPGGGHAGSTIDHLVVRGGSLVHATVEDGAGLSDHEPVRAEVAFGDAT